MKIGHLHLPSGTTEGIPMLIDAHWSLEQAIAVYELLDDLREQVWRHYGHQIAEHYREVRVTTTPGPADCGNQAGDDDSF